MNFHNTSHLVQLKTPEDVQEVPNNPLPAKQLSGPLDEPMIWNELKTIYDPEIPVNIVDLGLIYSLRIIPLEGAGKRIEVAMTLTAPGCAMGDVLKTTAESRLSQLPDVREVRVNIVFDPPWRADLMSEAAKLQLGL